MFESQPPVPRNVAVFENAAFKEISRQSRSPGRVLIQHDRVLSKKGVSEHRHTPRKAAGDTGRRWPTTRRGSSLRGNQAPQHRRLGRPASGTERKRASVAHTACFSCLVMAAAATNSHRSKRLNCPILRFLRQSYHNQLKKKSGLGIRNVCSLIVLLLMNSEKLKMFLGPNHFYCKIRDLPTSASARQLRFY